ncbi:DUF3343 domain-containing protein [Soehngenia saccharolytica]|nr:DUF3343 domain-containing protein [Tissierellales bacterium]TJX66422.1 DUF3343 domain-containing protein [Soehngenia saccharolytica]
MTRHYILFPNSNQGIKLTNCLKKENISFVISPTPRKLSTCCGISVIYDKENEDKIKRIIEQENIEINGFFTLD